MENEVLEEHAISIFNVEVYKVSNWLGYYIAKNMVTQTHRKW
jgi:hypothetical protein